MPRSSRTHDTMVCCSRPFSLSPFLSRRFDAINCSTALSRLAMHWKARAIPWESRQTVDRALPLLLSHLVRNRAELTPRALATSLYGLSKLRKADARLLGALEPAVVAACPGFTPQELSNVLWAHGKARVVAPAALAALAEQAERRAASFKPQEISSIVSSLAALNQTPPRMLEAMEEQVGLHAMAWAEVVPAAAWMHELRLTVPGAPRDAVGSPEGFLLQASGDLQHGPCLRQDGGSFLQIAGDRRASGLSGCSSCS